MWLGEERVIAEERLTKLKIHITGYTNKWILFYFESIDILFTERGKLCLFSFVWLVGWGFETGSHYVYSLG